jgi:hypothetical protein
MTIESAGSTVSYAGNDLTSTFAFPYSYQVGADFVVTVTVEATQVTTTLVYGTDYTVNPATNSPATNGSILAVTPVASGSTITITRVTPLTQETEWQANDAYPANFQRMENALDKLTMALQEQVDGGTITDAGLGTGDATYSTFLRGLGPTPDDQRIWTNTLIGALGPVTVPTDAQTILEVQQDGAAAIKISAGVASPSSVRSATDGDTNAWVSQWVYDPNLAAWGWQPYGGSIQGTFEDGGNVTFPGNLSVTGTTNSTLYTGAADASLITTGLVDTARLGSGSATTSTFLRGDQTWAVVSSGGGAVNTTTTTPFTIAAVDVTQTVAVTSATGIVAGTYLQISDGAHTIIGHATLVVGLNVTLNTDSIIIGTAGNTMASGAAVQSSTIPGNNSIQIVDGSFPLQSYNTLTLTGNLSGPTPGPPEVSLSITSESGGNATIEGYANSFFKIESIKAVPFPYDQIAYKQAASSNWSKIGSGVAGNVLRYADATLLQFGTIGASSITAASLTPALLNVTNSLTDGYNFTYDSASGHFKMVAPSAAFTGTAAQFINGVGTATNVLAGGNGDLILAQTSPVVNGTRAMRLFSSTGSTSSGQFIPVAYNSGTVAWDVVTDPGYFTIGGPLSVNNPTFPSATRNTSFINMNLDVTGQVFGEQGFWDRIRTVSNPTGTQTIDPLTHTYVRFTSIASNFTIAVADTTTVPTPPPAYATEITVEFRGVGANVVTWPGTIVWVDGGTAPVPDAVNVTIIKLIRAQANSLDGLGAKWYGYRLASASAAAYTDAQARSAVLNSTYLPSSSSITATVVAGTSATYSIPNSGVTNAMLAGSIQTDKIQGVSVSNSGTNFLNDQGFFTTPSGGGGGGGNVSNTGSYVWSQGQTWSQGSTFNGANTFNTINTFQRTFGTLSSSTIKTHVNGLYTEDTAYTKDGYGIGMYITDNFATPPGSEGIAAAWINHTVTGRTIGGESIHHGVDLQSTLTSGFNISHTQITHSKRLNGAYADSVWFNSFGPDSNFSVTPDAAGIVHEWNTGATRIGELNYGNAWGDFGFLSDRTGPTRWASGLEFFPDWLPGSDQDTGYFHYNTSWAIAIGGAGPGAGGGNSAKNWIGMMLCLDSIVGKNDHAGIIGGGVAGSTAGGGGYGLQIHGSTVASSNPIGKAINILHAMDVGIDISEATITAEAVSGHSNKPAIQLLSGQAICFKAPTGANTGVYIWFNGTNLVATKDGGNTTATII